MGFGSIVFDGKLRSKSDRDETGHAEKKLIWLPRVASGNVEHLRQAGDACDRQAPRVCLLQSGVAKEKPGDHTGKLEMQTGCQGVSHFGARSDLDEIPMTGTSESMAWLSQATRRATQATAPVSRAGAATRTSTSRPRLLTPGPATRARPPCRTDAFPPSCFSMTARTRHAPKRLPHGNRAHAAAPIKSSTRISWVAFTCQQHHQASPNGQAAVGGIATSDRSLRGSTCTRCTDGGPLPIV